MSTTPEALVDLYFRSRFETQPQGITFVPGRVVLLGEHLDHQGGPVLAGTLPQGVYVAYGVRPDHKVRLHALNARAVDSFETTGLQASGRRWADMGRGVFARMSQSGRRMPGMNLAVYGDLAVKSGLASSAAYVTSLLLAALEVAEMELAPDAIARDVAAIEKEWADVACGPMDPYVEVVGKPGQIVHLDTAAMTHEILELPPDVELVHANTGIERRLDQTPYNERLEELDRALAAVRTVHPDLASLAQLTPEQFESAAPIIPEPARRRARHVVSEAARVRTAVEALSAGDMALLGRLMWAGHESLARDYESSLPAIDERVQGMQGDPEILGARLQGAGWGGALAVLKRHSHAADELIDEIWKDPDRS
mgnify:CR=1 FL=1